MFWPSIWSRGKLENVKKANILTLPLQKDSICGTVEVAIRSSAGTSRTWQRAAPHE